MKGRGKPIGKGHKGQHRRFTDFEAIEAEQKKLAKQTEWRRQRGDDEDEDDEEEEEEDSSEEQSSEEEDATDEEEEAKPKGVESLIEIHNPNRIVKKAAPEVKAGTSTAAKPEMSRREREEAERQRKSTAVSAEQAREDLARLALVKQQRETARLKREAELKAKEVEKQKAKEAAAARR